MRGVKRRPRTRRNFDHHAGVIAKTNTAMGKKRSTKAKFESTWPIALVITALEGPIMDKNMA